jgi:uncharacterized membrane protein
MTKTRLEAFSDGVLSFVYVGIYWNNHHHRLHAATRIGAGAVALLWPVPDKRIERALSEHDK